jgi:murein DD-endopeptidase MepM/ murein hydrolase activator NlpD
MKERWEPSLSKLKKQIALLGTSLFLLVSFGTPLFAGTGIYPELNNTKKAEVNYSDQASVPPERVGKYKWSEESHAYIPFDWSSQQENPFPSMSDAQLKKLLPPAPSYKDSVPGRIVQDTLIFSGPSTPENRFEDNGPVRGGTRLVVLYENLGYYFVELENGDRGFLPVDLVALDDLKKNVVKSNVVLQATTLGVLGITPSQNQTYPVYPSMSTSATAIGSIGGTWREVVQVNFLDTSNGVEWYNITYRTASATKTGYIQKGNIYIPPFTDTSGGVLTKPISSGIFTNDFYSGHAGIDIEANGIPVYSIAPSTMQYRVSYTLQGTGSATKLQFQSYGRHAVLSTTVKLPSTGQTYSLETVYAHLGAYSNDAEVTLVVPPGNISKTFSLRYANSELTSAQISGGLTAAAKIVESNGTKLDSKSVAKGYTIGTTGQTGNASAPHLHYEVTSASAGNYNPFNYVLFWGMDYRH